MLEAAYASHPCGKLDKLVLPWVLSFMHTVRDVPTRFSCMRSRSRYLVKSPSDENLWLI